MASAHPPHEASPAQTAEERVARQLQEGVRAEGALLQEPAGQRAGHRRGQAERGAQPGGRPGHRPRVLRHPEGADRHPEGAALHHGPHEEGGPQQRHHRRVEVCGHGGGQGVPHRLHCLLGAIHVHLPLLRTPPDRLTHPLLHPVSLPPCFE
ncbi:hypothetical protein CEXT_787301 [Caerostris extrusa]|uniref:Uncharacterized protein n=1 Tax=Caerostris extrusa TaxID=172846 RepID=A0AAV4UMJ9_CAEEX|nr:hypothetical protein CEXT_787301 [Caerostris extrusa]